MAAEVWRSFATSATVLVPHAIWTSGRYDRYSEMSALVMVSSKMTPLSNKFSLMRHFWYFLERFSKENPLEICKRIQRVAALGVTCSIWPGERSRSFVKIASEQVKASRSYRGFLAQRPLSSTPAYWGHERYWSCYKDTSLKPLRELSRADATYLTSPCWQYSFKDDFARAQGKKFWSSWSYPARRT